MQKTFTIYKVTNVITGKVYVGQTSYSAKRRFQWHKSTAVNGRGKSPLCKDIVKYGAEHFIVDELETNLSSDNVDRCEQFWIQKLNTVIPNGYNVQLGGRNNFGYATFRYRGGNYGKSSHGKIAMCDRDTGKVLMIHDGVMDSERYLKTIGYEKANHWPITKCCQGKQKHAYGYKWKFVNN